MKVRFKKLNKDAKAPTKAHATDAGYDLYCISAESDIKNGNIIYKTGIAVEIPRGCVGLLFSRSSICKYDLIQCNAVGVIDSGYRGDLTFVFRRMQPFANCYKVGDKIGQLIIIPYPEIELEEVEELSDSDRGDNGFGSSGK